MKAKPQKLLFIDDDSRLQSLLKEYFTPKGLQTISALDGHKAIELLKENSIDIIILDLMLPDMDGFEVLRRLRSITHIPVIMLTATEDETDRIVGLELGADDYLHKPINPRELLARIKAVLRRSKGFETARSRQWGTEADTFIFSPQKNQARLNGLTILLTTVECLILEELIGAKGRVLSRDHLMETVRGNDFEVYDRSIDVHISRIRKKVEKNPAKPRHIKTIWGKGYMWDGEVIVEEIPDNI